MKFKKFYKKHFLISILFIASIIIVLLINYVFSNYCQFWKHGEMTGDIITNFLLGYLGSVIFFYMVVFLKEEQDQENNLFRIRKSIEILLNERVKLMNMLFKNSNYQVYSNEAIMERCLSIGFYEIELKSNIGKQHNWIEYFELIEVVCIDYSEKILKLPNLDSELIKLLAGLQDINMFNRSKLVVGNQEKEARKLGGVVAKQIIQFKDVMDSIESFAKVNNLLK